MTPPQGLTVGKVILVCEGEFDELNRCHFSMWWMEDHARNDLWAPDHGRRPFVQARDYYADPQEYAAEAEAGGRTAIVRSSRLDGHTSPVSTGAWGVCGS